MEKGRKARIGASLLGLSCLARIATATALEPERIEVRLYVLAEVAESALARATRVATRSLSQAGVASTGRKQLKIDVARDLGLVDGAGRVGAPGPVSSEVV